MLSTGACKKEECDLTTIKLKELTAQDGLVYPIVLYPDGKEWFAANLQTLVFANGDTIPLVFSDSVWSSQSTAAASFYDNDSTARQRDDYGLLYNYYAVEDSRNLCPDGWHVATAEDWQDLIDCVGGSSTAGIKLKSTDLWNNPNNEIADNESNFSANPQGLRLNTGAYENQRFFSYFWMAEDESNGQGGMRNMSYISEGIGSFYEDKRIGASVRCVRD